MRGELETLNMLSPCSRPGGETRGDTGVTFLLCLCSTGEYAIGEYVADRSEPVGEGQSIRGEGLHGLDRNPGVAVGLLQGLLVQMSDEEDVHLTFFSFFLSFFFAFGDGVFPLSTEEERRRPRVDLASRFTVHQLLLPELSF